MPDEAIAALAALDLAMADTSGAYVARRVAELRLVASMVRSSGRDGERMSGAGLVPTSSDGAADAGIVSPSAGFPGLHGAVGDPAAPAPAMAVSPESGPGRSPDGTVDAAPVVPPGNLSTSAPPVDVDPLPPAAAAALAALDRANADTPEAALARRIDEARLRASFARSRRHLSDRGRPETETGLIASAAEAVARTSPAPLGITAQADDLRQHGVEDAPQHALSALLALDLAMADTPAAYVARRIAEMRIRASIQKRICSTLSVDGRQAPSTPSGVAAGEPSPSRGTDTLPHAISDDPTGLMPSLDDVPPFGRDGSVAGDALAVSGVERLPSWTPDFARTIVVSDPEDMLSSHDDAGSAAPQRASVTETDPTVLGTADRSLSDLVRLYHALGEERRSGRGDATSPFAATPSASFGAIDGVETSVTPPHVGAESPIASPVLPPSSRADPAFASAGSPNVLSTPASQARISSPVPTVDVAHSAIASGDRTAVSSAMEAGSDPVSRGFFRSAVPAIGQAASEAPVRTGVAEAASKGEALRAGASFGPAPSSAAGLSSFQDAAPKPQLPSPPAAPSTLNASNGQETVGAAPRSPPVVSTSVETILSPLAPVPAVDSPTDDAADWSDIELGEPEDIGDELVALETPSPDVKSPSPDLPPASQPSVRAAYGLLRDRLGKGLRWLNGGPPDPIVPGDGPASLPAEGSLVPPSLMQIAELAHPPIASATFAASSVQVSPTAVPDGPADVARSEAPQPKPTISTMLGAGAAPPLAKSGAAAPSDISKVPNAPPPQRPESWNPGMMPGKLRSLAGLYTQYLIKHGDDWSRAARIASIRAALGPDADQLEQFVRHRVGLARAGDDHAQLFLDQLTRRADPLRGADEKEAAKREDAEIRKHGGRPVPVRPPYDPREGSTAERFLAAAFLAARATRNDGLEQAVILIHAERRDGEPAWSQHMMERGSVWAVGDPSAAEVFRASQPGQDRLSSGLEVSRAGWRRVLVGIYWNAFKVQLLGGGRDDVGR